MISRLLTALGALALVVSLVAAGLGVCCLPQSTEALARLYSGSDNTSTHFTHEELITAALAGRDYTVGSHDKNALYHAIYDINASAAAAGRAGTGALDVDVWAQARAADITDGTTAGNNLPSVEHMEALIDEADEAYVLPTEAVGHLDDVYAVISQAGVVLLVIAAVALGGLIFTGLCWGRRVLGRVFSFAGAAVLISFAALGVWAAIDFYGFFSVFHSLFFAQGSWTFASDSLLITMYPLAFWIGMGAIWLVVSGLLSILALICGHRLRKGGRTKRTKRNARAQATRNAASEA